MLKSDSSLLTLIVATALAGGIVLTVERLNAADDETRSAASHVMPRLNAETVTETVDVERVQLAQATDVNSPAADRAARPTWAATAAGRVEPRGGMIDVTPETPGVVVEKYVDVGDRVQAGDLLYRLRDDELSARWNAARTEIDVRKRERAEDPSAEEAPKKAEAAKPRVDAETAVGDAQLAFYQARRAFDEAYAKLSGGTGKTEDVEAARSRMVAAEKELADKRAALAVEQSKDGVPLPTRLEGGFVNALDDLRVLETRLERTRIRAPSNGTVLDLDAEVGETVAASPLRPIAKIGDLDQLTIRSEIEERDLTAVSVGQDVVVRSGAFPGRDFTGKVKWVAPTLAP
ncbi:MAG: efflux RND transporter periplasmic adaptor subunit, partial [Pseudomonadota bacterium]